MAFSPVARANRRVSDPQGADMIAGLSHVSIAVPDIEAAAKALLDRYGLATGPRLTNEQQGVRLAYVELPGARIELMEPSRPDSPVAKFLERNPKGGIHHFSLEVASVDAAIDALKDKNVRVLGDGQGRNVAGGRIAFLHPADFLGALVELEEHR
jgi:methylmalonyl-CoA/ethylmalonyl-CoA epimerase